MTHRALFLSLSLVSLVAVACGSSDSSGSGSPSSCKGSGIPGGSSQPTACDTCQESKCGAELTAAYGSGYKSGVAGGACQALMQCVASCGCSDTSCLSGCQSKLDAGCKAATDAVDACEASKCKSECAATGAGGSGAGGAGTGGTTGGANFSCTTTSGDSKSCVLTPLPAGSTDAANMQCTSSGGTPGTGCDSAGAIGTCSISGTKITYYTPSTATEADLKGACMQAGGTWTTGG